MDNGARRTELVPLIIAACATAWVGGATLFYGSGGLDTAGVIPTIGCVIALWGAVRREPPIMWSGTTVVVISSLVFVFSVGPVVAPAAIALVIASVLLVRRLR
ncbi:MAG: hypothetical protein WB245_00440 [Acidimicrobiia bacterium]|jgi:hypothetical protein